MELLKLRQGDWGRLFGLVQKSEALETLGEVGEPCSGLKAVPVQAVCHHCRVPDPAKDRRKFPALVQKGLEVCLEDVVVHRIEA